MTLTMYDECSLLLNLIRPSRVAKSGRSWRYGFLCICCMEIKLSSSHEQRGENNHVIEKFILWDKNNSPGITRSNGFRLIEWEGIWEDMRNGIIYNF